MNVTKQQYNPAAHQSFHSHRRVGKLMSSYSLQLHCLSRLQWFRLYHVSAHSTVLLVLVDNLHGRYAVAPVLLFIRSCKITHVSTSVYGEFQGVHGSRKPGCNKRGVNDTDIDLTYHYSARGGSCHDQCGARSQLFSSFPMHQLLHWWNANMLYWHPSV